MEQTGKAVAKQRSKPTLVPFGKGLTSSSGRWNNDVMADYVILHGRGKWLKVGELARVAYGGNGSPNNKEMVRHRIHKLFRTLYERRVLLVIEYGPPHNQAVSVKVYDRTSKQDQEAFDYRLNRMRQRLKLTAEQYEGALLLAKET